MGGEQTLSVGSLVQLLLGIVPLLVSICFSLVRQPVFFSQGLPTFTKHFPDLTKSDIWVFRLD